MLQDKCLERDDWEDEDAILERRGKRDHRGTRQ